MGFLSSLRRDLKGGTSAYKDFIEQRGDWVARTAAERGYSSPNVAGGTISGDTYQDLSIELTPEQKAQLATMQPYFEAGGDSGGRIPNQYYEKLYKQFEAEQWAKYSEYQRQIKELNDEWLTTLDPQTRQRVMEEFGLHSSDMDKISKVGKMASLGIIGASGVGAALTGLGVLGGTAAGAGSAAETAAMADAAGGLLPEYGTTAAYNAGIGQGAGTLGTAAGTAAETASGNGVNFMDILNDPFSYTGDSGGLFENGLFTGPAEPTDFGAILSGTDPTSIEWSGSFDLGTGGSGGFDIADYIKKGVGAITGGDSGGLSGVLPTLAGLAATKVSPWLTNLASGGYFKDAKNLIDQSTSRINNVTGADLSNLIPELRVQVMQGTMSPAQAQAYQASLIGTMNAANADVSQQQNSNMLGVTSDAGTIQDQRQALERLAAIGQSGMTDADRAQLQATMNATNANAAQQRAAQIQALQMQGNAGTGAELAARLSGAQGAANANAAAGAKIASDAQARALAAIQANLAGAGNLNRQLFEQQAQKAQAQDAINQFNTAARNAMAQQNAQFQQQANQQNFNTANQIALANQAAMNQNAQLNAQLQQQAAQRNFDTANEIAGRNTGILNTQAMLPLNTAQQSFTNKLNQAQSAAGSGLTGAKLLNEQGKVIAGASTAAAQNAANTTNTVLNQRPQQSSSNDDLWKAAAKTGLQIAGSIFSDEDLKTDKKQLTDADVDKMFGDLTGYRYRYKGSPVSTTGVMAQDVENTPNRNAVVDTPAGKMLSGDLMFGNVLAALANNTERIQKLEGKK